MEEVGDKSDFVYAMVQDLLAQVAERDTHIRELEMENIKLRANQQRVRDVLLTST